MQKLPLSCNKCLFGQCPPFSVCTHCVLQLCGTLLMCGKRVKVPELFEGSATEELAVIKASERPHATTCKLCRATYKTLSFSLCSCPIPVYGSATGPVTIGQCPCTQKPPPVVKPHIA